MRSDIIRLYKVVHSWTGIIAGLFLFVAFYAGAITVFEQPLARWASPPDRVVLAPLERAHELITATMAVRPESRREFTLHLGGGEEVPARLTWQKSLDDDSPMASTLAPDGGVQVVRTHPTALGRFVDELHRTAGIPGEVDLGAGIMGLVSALYVLALVSGVVVLLPSLIKDLFAFRMGANLKRMWLDAHNLVGLFSLPFHLMIALTAVGFGLHDQIYDALDQVVYEGRMKDVMRASNPFGAIKRDRQPAEMLPPEELLSRLRTMAPQFEPYAIEYRDAGTGGAAVRVWGKDERYLMRGKGFAVMSPVTGAIVNTEYLPGHQGSYSAVVAAFFALHFGSFGGPVVKWGYVLLGLAGAFLFYSGNLLWIETRRRTERRAGGPVEQSRSTRWMAALTVGVCVGCIAGLSVAIAGSKWLNGRVANPEAWYYGLYYAVFLANLAYAFGRGAGRAGSELLWLAAAATSAIPLTSLLAWAQPGLGLWAWEAELGVDLTALAGALALARMAWVTGRRTGPHDSVWSRHGCRHTAEPVAAGSTASP